MANPDKFCSFPFFIPLFIVLSSEGLSPTGIPKLVNLILFFVVLYLLLRKPTREFFQQRLSEVRATLDRAAKEKEEASKKLAEIDLRLARLDAELAEIRAQAGREMMAEQARLEQEAHADAERLRQLAHREIDAAKQNALVELREFAAEKAVDLAEQIIRRELTLEDDARLVERASVEMEQMR